ncbi:hypothetical protein AYI69_g6805, partial [Smittium culicis]
SSAESSSESSTESSSESSAESSSESSAESSSESSAESSSESSAESSSESSAESSSESSAESSSESSVESSSESSAESSSESSAESSSESSAESSSESSSVFSTEYSTVSSSESYSESTAESSSETNTESLEVVCKSEVGDVLNLSGSNNSPVPLYDANQMKIIPCSSLNFEFSFEVEKTSDIYFIVSNTNGISLDIMLGGQIGLISGDYALGDVKFASDYAEPEGETTIITIKSSKAVLSMYRDGILYGSADQSDFKYPELLSNGIKQLYFAADIDGASIKNIVVSCTNQDGVCESIVNSASITSESSETTDSSESSEPVESSESSESVEPSESSES